MSRDPIPSWSFVLVVVRLGRRFLLVHERKHGQLWYLPAGRIEPGEGILEAACRETLEETGVPIIPEGILRIEHTPQRDGSLRMRAILTARAADDTPPKAAPDEHSLGAGWFTLEEIARLPLRGAEVLQLFKWVEAGAAVYSLALLRHEGEGYA